jgi:hypothetical protein
MLVGTLTLITCSIVVAGSTPAISGSGAADGFTFEQHEVVIGSATMNGFVIAVGAYFKPLMKQAKATATRLGRVSVQLHGTSCKVPVALDAIAKIEGLGRVGKKRKSIRC